MSPETWEPIRELIIIGGGRLNHKAKRGINWEFAGKMIMAGYVA
jgi:hypothetical protein